MSRIDMKLCCGCEACRNACPVDAVKMAEDKEGFLYPQIDNDKCINCNICKKVCPVEEKISREENELYFGARAVDDSLRLESSSGGIFPVLAKKVTADNGFVFAAGMDNDGSVRHMCISSVNEISRLQKTKYVQSETGDAFRQLKSLLENGSSVLFVGTPCQCRGLQLYLGKDYEKLIVADLICYGVPSPGIWKKYVAFLEKQNGGKLEAFSFRDKRNRDNGHTVSYSVSGNEHTCHINHDLFCRKYFMNEIIRPSCHSCRFCTPIRSSDLTLGDFFNAEKYNPDFGDGMGASLIILHSEKGRALWRELSDELEYFECSREQAMQPRLSSPTEPSPKRKIKMLLYHLLPFSVWLKGRRLFKR